VMRRMCGSCRPSHLSRNLPPVTMANMAMCRRLTAPRSTTPRIVGCGGGKLARHDCASAVPQGGLLWHTVASDGLSLKASSRLIPSQRASGIAAFYSATGSFVGWLA